MQTKQLGSQAPAAACKLPRSAARLAPAHATPHGLPFGEVIADLPVLLATPHGPSLKSLVSLPPVLVFAGFGRSVARNRPAEGCHQPAAHERRGAPVADRSAPQYERRLRLGAPREQERDRAGALVALAAIPVPGADPLELMVFNPMGIVITYLQRDGEEVSCELSSSGVQN